MHYDVLKEPWIPVQKASGQSDILSLYDTFAQAHTIKQVNCDSPLETCAVLRFLIAFAMDAYGCSGKLKNVFARKAIYQQETFDEDVFQTYIDLCKEEGVSFDLFDEKRPFLQAIYDPEKDDEKRISVTNLFHSLPSGNNHVHFDHTMADSRAFSPSECLRGLLACQLFATSMAGGYPSSVNDTPCFYVFLEGDTLFQTIVLSMVSIKESPEESTQDIMPIAWRNRDIITSQKYADVSMLAGLTWQPRRVTLIAHEDGSVREMYYQPGKNFNPNGRWLDPHVTFLKNKKEEFYTLKPKQGRAPWRDVGAYAMSQNDQACRPALILKNASKIKTNPVMVSLLTLGVATDNAKCLGWFWDRIHVPFCILNDMERANQLRMDLAFCEEVASLLKNALKNMLTAFRSKAVMNGIVEEFEAKYFHEMHQFFFPTYMEALSQVDTTQSGFEEQVIDLTNKKIIQTTDRLLMEACDRYDSSAEEMKAQMVANRSFKGERKKRITKRTTIIGE